MKTNLDRFKKDLNELIECGDLLQMALQYDVLPSEFVKQVKEEFGNQADAYLKKLPAFASEYESWYSESLALLRQLLPDRVQNFISFYEKPKSRKDITYSNYVMQDYLQGLVVRYGGEVRVDTRAALLQFKQQLNIVKAASARFESSLFEIRQLVQADLFDSELEASRELLKNNFLRAAGAVSGVVLEKHLKQVCSDHNLALKKNAGIGDCNEALKSNGVIEIPQWRHISLLGDIRNICDHSKNVEPTSDQVRDLIDGTEKVLKTIF